MAGKDKKYNSRKLIVINNFHIALYLSKMKGINNITQYVNNLIALDAIKHNINASAEKEAEEDYKNYLNKKNKKK